MYFSLFLSLSVSPLLSQKSLTRSREIYEWMFKERHKQINLIVRAMLWHRERKACSGIYSRERIIWQTERGSLKMTVARWDQKARWTTVRSTCFISTLYHLNFSMFLRSARGTLRLPWSLGGSRTSPTKQKCPTCWLWFFQKVLVVRFCDFSHLLWSFEVVLVSQMLRQTEARWKLLNREIASNFFCAFNPFNFFKDLPSSCW